MANKYAFVKPNGKVITITRMSGQDAAQAGPRFVQITDPTIEVDDTIDKDTGALVSKNVRDVQESRTACRELVRQELRATDWTQVADAPVNQAAWATYRQALRDVPLQIGFPINVTWPVAPA